MVTWVATCGDASRRTTVKYKAKYCIAVLAVELYIVAAKPWVAHLKNERAAKQSLYDEQALSRIP